MTDIDLLPDASGWAMEFIRPTVSAEFLERWPQASEIAGVMGSIYWSQLAQAIDGTAEPSGSPVHDINAIYCALLEWGAQQELMT